MNKRMILLTTSTKYGGLCVAGLDYHNGEWIRLVSTDEEKHGAVTAKDIRYENGQTAKRLDVIDVDIIGYDNNTIQPENHIIKENSNIKYVKSISIKDVMGLYQGREESLIFDSNLYYVEEKYASRLGRSLTLATVNNLNFTDSLNDNGQIKTKLSFYHNGHKYINMSVTDPTFFNEDNHREINKAMIVVSIGSPFNGKCFKFVAAIYPLS